jgi:hypothetical protein
LEVKNAIGKFCLVIDEVSSISVL